MREASGSFLRKLLNRAFAPGSVATPNSMQRRFEATADAIAINFAYLVRERRIGAVVPFHLTRRMGVLGDCSDDHPSHTSSLSDEDARVRSILPSGVGEHLSEQPAMQAGGTLHSAGSNRSDRTREVLTIIYTFLVGAGVAHFHTIGKPVALTSIAFLIGMLLLPFGEETRGKPLPA
jgi:hypothetical protein